jgi:hypothetical protein
MIVEEYDIKNRRFRRRYYGRRSFATGSVCLFFVRWISVGEKFPLPRLRIQVVHGTVPQ